MRVDFIVSAAVMVAAAPAAANIGTINFSGTVLTLNGMAVAPVAGSVVGSITLSDGGDPDGPPATPDNFTGTVTFSDIFSDPGDATFIYSTPLFGGNSLDMNPYHSASVTLVNGKLSDFSLFTDGDGDTFTIGSGSFAHTEYDVDYNVIGIQSGTYRLDEMSSDTPEPATWTLLVTGFGLVGTRLRRQVGTAV